MSTTSNPLNNSEDQSIDACTKQILVKTIQIIEEDFDEQTVTEQANDDIKYPVIEHNRFDTYNCSPPGAPLFRYSHYSRNKNNTTENM